jgi:hypothetical protein
VEKQSKKKEIGGASIASKAERRRRPEGRVKPAKQKKGRDQKMRKAAAKAETKEKKKRQSS